MRSTDRFWRNPGSSRAVKATENKSAKALTMLADISDIKLMVRPSIHDVSNGKVLATALTAAPVTLVPMLQQQSENCGGGPC